MDVIAKAMDLSCKKPKIVWMTIKFKRIDVKETIIMFYQIVNLYIMMVTFWTITLKNTQKKKKETRTHLFRPETQNRCPISSIARCSILANSIVKDLWDRSHLSEIMSIKC